MASIEKLPPPKITPGQKPPKELIKQAAYLSQIEARRLLTLYWRAKRARAATDMSLGEMDNEFLKFFARLQRRLHTNLEKALYVYMDQHIEARWAVNVPGIGPFITGGLLTFIDMDRCGDSVDKIYRYAGLDPTCVWITWKIVDATFAEVQNLYGPVLTDRHIDYICHKLSRKSKPIIRTALRYGNGSYNWYELGRALVVRPWNPTLKYIAYWIGEEFRNNCNKKPDSLYSQLYRESYDYYWEKNHEGKYKELAIAEYKSKSWKAERFEEDHPAYWLKQGVLTARQIRMRAQRRTTKIFIAHYHQIAYYARHHKLPKKPWILRKWDGSEYICPDWPFKVVPPG